MNALVRYDIGNNLSLRIINAARTVFECLGPDQSEPFYRKAFFHALQLEKFEVEACYPVDSWQGCELANLYFLDYFVENQVIVELKFGLTPLRDTDRLEVIEYLWAAGVPIGLLMNFGPRRLEIERVFPPD